MRDIVTRRARPLLRRLVGRPSVQHVLRWLARREFERVRGRRVAASVGRRAARLVRLEHGERVASIEALVECFFEIVGATRPQLFVEAGAKEGVSSSRAATLLDDARVIAFEANPYTYRRFRDRHGPDIDGVDYRNVALADGADEVSFYVLRTPDGRPRADGQSSMLKRVDADQTYEEVRVAATTLDAVSRGHPGPVAIWMDVEGATSTVLGGAAECLRRTVVLIVEVELRQFWQGQAVDDDVVEQIEAAGLRAVARDYQSSLQYNLLFVAESLADDPGVAAALARLETPF